MMRFLIVDDDPKNREAIKFWLAREFAGATFIEATSREEVGAALLSGDFDAAIVGCQPAWATWKDVLEALKNKWPDVPVVTITDGGNDAIVVEAMKAGLSDYALNRPLLRFLGEAVRESLERVSLSRGRRYLLRGAGAPTAVIDFKFKIIEVNHALVETVGRPKEEIQGRKCYEALHGLSSPPPNCPLVRARKTKRHEAAEVKFGPGNVYLVSCTPVISNGEAVSFVHVAIDITNLQRAETWLRVAGKVMDATSEGVVVTDANKVILWVNEAFTLITGYTLEDVKGKTPFFLQPDLDDKTLFRHVDNILARERRWQGRIWFRRKNGELYPQWVTLSIVRNDEGAVTNYVIVCTSEARKEGDPRSVESLTHYDALTGLGNPLQCYDRKAQDRRFAAVQELRRAMEADELLVYYQALSQTSWKMEVAAPQTPVV